MPDTRSASTPRPPQRRARRIAFRLAAILLGLSPFVLAELLCVAFGWGRPDYHEDPFVGFSAVRPLFVLSDDGTRFEIAPSRQVFFRSDHFAAQKGAREFRIFCLGGSTVQGRPFAIETSFTTFLEINLNAAAPSRQWRVVNCGGVSYASYRLVPILQEVLRHQPDLIILYTGHNEFLEDRTYEHLKARAPLISDVLQWASRRRLYNLARSAWLEAARPNTKGPRARAVLTEEVQAILDYQGGMQQYRRDEPWRQAVIDHFDYNLRRMLHMADEAGVPLILCNPVTNLRDCPPFKVQHRDTMTAEELQRWNALLEQARQAFKRDTREALEYLHEAERIDDQHAGLAYELAKTYDALGQADTARIYYLKAKELDICPLRMVEPMHESLWQIAAETDTPVVDVRALIESVSRDRIPGGYMMMDHVHPSVRGHQMIADALLEQMVQQGFLRPAADWQVARDQRVEAHLAALDDFYFLKGEQRLRALRNWAAGRAMLKPK